MRIKELDVRNCQNIFNRGDLKFIVIDDLFDTDFVLQCSKEFRLIDENNFVKYENSFFEFGKYALNDVNKMPEKLKKLFSFIHSPGFIKLVQGITGLDDLLVDEKRWGGGLHMTKKDGYLAVHKDFNILPTSYNEEKQMLRCINLIGYMNPDWKEEDGGELEFWDESGEKSIMSIKPKFNRWVLFDTRNNYHGHPHPYKGDSPRTSIASYYYIKTNVMEEKWMSTEYLKLPWLEDSEEYQRVRKERADHKLRYSGILNGGKK
jgi:Rps23 Pro-64 3,4-dihydroxylase Tpa1-like proline 4-hydroxylase